MHPELSVRKPSFAALLQVMVREKASAFRSERHSSSLEKLVAGDPSRESALKGRWDFLTSALVTNKGGRGRTFSAKTKQSPVFLLDWLLAWVVPDHILLCNTLVNLSVCLAHIQKKKKKKAFLKQRIPSKSPD